MYMYKHCFPEGHSEQAETEPSRLKNSSFRCRRKIGAPAEKPTEATLDWKQNGHTAESNPGSVVHSAKEVPLCYLLPPNEHGVKSKKRAQRTNLE